MATSHRIHNPPSPSPIHVAPRFPWGNYLVAEVSRENLILCPLFRLFSHYPGIVQFRKNVALEIIWGNKLVRRTGLAGPWSGPLAGFLLADPMAGMEFELTVGQITGQSHCSGKLQAKKKGKS